MNIEFNKIVAGVLVAGITAYACGYVAKGLVKPSTLAKNAYEVQVAPEASSVAGAAPVVAEAEPIDDLLPKADVARGEKIMKVCTSCHTFAAGEPNRIGPNLHGVVGRAVASAPGFAYSDAMKAKGGSWDIKALNALLWKPQKTVPGTKMSFAGLPKPEDRAALIKWLQEQK